MNTGSQRTRIGAVLPALLCLCAWGLLPASGAPAPPRPALRVAPGVGLPVRTVAPLPITQISGSLSPTGARPPAGHGRLNKEGHPKLAPAGVVNPIRPQPIAPAGPRSGLAPLAATDELTLVKNVAIGPAGYGATQNLGVVGEPSVAVNGDTVFYTANWFAAISLDGGNTFSYINPYTFFPNAANGFCCDQVAHYIPQIDTFVWLLQYIETATGENVDRLAFGTTAEVRANQWKFVDLTSQALGLPGQWMDFPDLAVGANSLYLTTNVFNAQNQFTQALFARIPHSGLQGTGSLAGMQFFKSATDFGYRPAQNVGTRGYFATHVNLAKVRVYHWDEGSASVFPHDVNIGTWSDVDYSSNTPDGFNWLSRADPRIEGATLAGTDLWLGWMAGKRPGTGQTQPYVEVVRINTTNFSLVSQPIIWNPNFAYAYPGFSTNENGEVGVSLAFGGGVQQVSHGVGILTGTPRLLTTEIGTHGPLAARWGDYFTVRPFRPNGKLFAASGFTLQGGNGDGFVRPRYLVFGRSGETTPSFNISGTVTLSGIGLAGVTVGTGAVTAVTAANGTYSLTGLGPGAYVVTPTLSNFTFMPASQNVNIAAASVTGVNFAATATVPTFSISGTVSEAGIGIGGVTVSAGGGGSTSTAGDGNYVLNGLTAGTYTVTPAATGYTFLPTSRSVTVGPNAVNQNFTGASLPPPPSGLTAVSQVGPPLSIRLNWTDNASNETGFKVEFRTASTAFAQIGSPTPANTTQATITGVQRGTAYTFRVRAVNGAGDSAYSNEAHAATPPNPPKKPGKLVAKALTSTSIRLTWKDTSTTETEFKVEIAVGAGAFQLLGTVGSPALPTGGIAVEVTSLTPNTQYRFRVRSSNTGGDSGNSNTAKAKTKAL